VNGQVKDSAEENEDEPVEILHRLNIPVAQVTPNWTSHFTPPCIFGIHRIRETSSFASPFGKGGRGDLKEQT
jgi:hypothetical protein